MLSDAKHNSEILTHQILSFFYLLFFSPEKVQRSKNKTYILVEVLCFARSSSALPVPL